MIKAILTDLGKVVIYFRLQAFEEALSERCKLSLEKVQDIIHGREGMALLKQFEVAIINADVYRSEILNRLGIDLDQDEFWRIFEDIFTPNEEVIALYNEIKRYHPDLRFVTATNTDPRRLRRMIELSRITFHGVAASCKIGFAKPDGRFFTEALKIAEVEREHCLYIDDIGDYCLAAKQLGIMSHHYTTTVGLREEFRRSGLL